MNKLRIFAMTALAAAAIGVGGLVATPSASAMPRDCTALMVRANMYLSLEIVAIAAGDLARADYYSFWVGYYGDRVDECLG
jgi:hypothetical protein